MKIFVHKLIKTCGACPTQWEGETSDGDDVYIRYRWGYLSVRINNEEIFGVQLSDNLDGYLEYDELKKQINSFMIIPFYETSEIDW